MDGRLLYVRVSFVRSPLLRLYPRSFGPAHVVLAVALVLLGLFLYSAVQSAANGYRLNGELEALQAEVLDLRRQQAELVGLRAFLASDEYIEGVARTQFGLVRPGEVAVVVDARESDVPARRPGQRWWEALFDR